MRAFLVLSYLLLLSISSADSTSNDELRSHHGRYNLRPRRQIWDLHPDILHRIFTINEGNFEPDPSRRLVSKNWRDAADQSHNLWKFHIKKSCGEAVDLKLLFGSNQLAFKGIEEDSPCLEAILNATNPPDFISARLSQPPAIKSLTWNDIYPSFSQSVAFLRIFERLAPSLESLTMENRRFFANFFVPPTIKQRYVELFNRFKAAFKRLGPENLFELKIHAAPLAMAFLPNPQREAVSELLGAIARLKNLKTVKIVLLQIMKFQKPATIAVLRDLSPKMLNALVGKPIKSLWLQLEPGINPAVDIPAIQTIIGGFSSTLEFLVLDGLQSGAIIEHLSNAKLTSEFTKLKVFWVNDMQWNRPLPQDFIKDISGLPALEKLALPTMHSSDVWKWKLYKERADQLKSLRFNGSPQMFINIWTVGFRVVSLSDGENRVFSHESPSISLHENHSIQAKNYDDIETLLPAGPGDARFENLNNLLLQPIRGALIPRLIQKLPFLPRLRYLGLLIWNEPLYNAELGARWSDSLLIDLMASSSTEKLRINLIQPMSNPLELLCIVESLAGKKYQSKVSELIFEMIMPSAGRFQNIKEVLVKALPALLEQTSLKRFRLHLSTVEVLSWINPQN